VDDIGTVALYLFMSAFYGLFVWSLFVCIRVWIVSKKGWTIVKVLHCLLPLCLAMRAADLTVNCVLSGNDIMTRPPERQSPWWMLSAALPVYLFFTTYILVCLLWVYLYCNNYRTAQFLMNQIKWIYLAINVFVYSVFSILMGLMFNDKQGTNLRSYHIVEACFATVISFCSGVVFLIFGLLLYSRLRMLQSLTEQRKRIAAKVGYTTALCTFVFILRSVMITVSFFLFLSPTKMLINNLVWYSTIELIPSTVIFYAILLHPLNT